MTITLLNPSFSAKRQTISSAVTVGSGTQWQRRDQQDYVNCIFRMLFIHQAQKKFSTSHFVKYSGIIFFTVNRGKAIHQKVPGLQF